MGSPKEPFEIQGCANPVTADTVKGPTAAEAADAMRRAIVDYLMAQGPTVTLDALTKPIPGLGKPVLGNIARSTVYSAASRSELPFATFFVGRRRLAATTAVLRVLDLDPTGAGKGSA
jgi:hypothetical protein